jgi:hypothetical protein
MVQSYHIARESTQYAGAIRRGNGEAYESSTAKTSYLKIFMSITYRNNQSKKNGGSPVVYAL